VPDVKEVPVTPLELGRFGVVVNPGRGEVFLGAVAELERLDYAAIWVTGGPLEDLQQLAWAPAGAPASTVAA